MVRVCNKNGIVFSLEHSINHLLMESLHEWLEFYNKDGIAFSLEHSSDHLIECAQMVRICNKDRITFSLEQSSDHLLIVFA